mmetsp:Transcript_13548/g.31193  ORF Transcript_13548/g.31193 Transcript_13548/m.31193 type:complete len:111 (-) Transcript_13548:168-500(-)
MDVEDESAFVQDEVKAMVKETIDLVLHETSYNHTKVGQWTNDIVEECLKRLIGLNKPFKYIVTCVIMQRIGAGLHTATANYWDSANDGCVVCKHDTKAMYVIVTVFGIAI